MLALHVPVPRCDRSQGCGLIVGSLHHHNTAFSQETVSEAGAYMLALHSLVLCRDCSHGRSLIVGSLLDAQARVSQGLNPLSYSVSSRMFTPRQVSGMALQALCVG